MCIDRHFEEMELTNPMRAQSPTPTVVLSRFFNKTEDVTDPNTMLDKPPPPFFKTRPRATRRGLSKPLSAPSQSERTAALAAPSLVLTKQEQFEAYLGNCAPLMNYARECYGDAGLGGITTRQVRAWLNTNPQFIPNHLQGQEFHVDHIVSDGVGGQNWPLNYFLMPASINLLFGSWLTIEKRRYVGMQAWSSAVNFSTWCSQKARAIMPFGKFDPVGDKFLGKRSR